MWLSDHNSSGCYNDNLRLQSVQSAAARVITGARRCEHITVILRELHWLPLCQCIQFKLADFVFQALTWQELVYLADNYHLISNSDQWHLRCADTRTCIVPRPKPVLVTELFSCWSPQQSASCAESSQPKFTVVQQQTQVTVVYCVLSLVKT